VASIGSSSFFINLGYSINAMIMIGAGIKVSQCIGKGDEKGVKDYIQEGMLMSMAIGLIYAILLVVFGRSLIGFLQLNDQWIENKAYDYLVWSAPMLWFACINQLFARIFASLGNSKSAFHISILGIGINIVLDPLLIYGFDWGIVGAAVATLLAKLIATFGAEAIAAQKVGVQIEAITYMVTGGLNGAVASFIGQNYGAKQYDRLHKGYQAAIGIGCAYALLTSIIFWFFPEQLARLFVKETETVLITASYLRIIGYSQIFNGMEMVTNGLLTGIGKPKIPAFISVSFTALRLPMSWVLVRYWGVEGIWWSITLSTVLKGSLLVGIYLAKERKALTYQ